MNVRRGLAFCIAMALCTWALADNPEQQFEGLYGEKIKAALASPGKDAQIRLAAQLVDDADRLRDDPPLQAQLYLKAAEFASADRRGDLITARAARKLASLRSSSTASVREKLLLILRQHYSAAGGDHRTAVGRLLVDELESAADAKVSANELGSAAVMYREAGAIADSVDTEKAAQIKQKSRDLTAREVMQKRIDSLKAKFSTSSSDPKSAAELVRLLVVGMQRPDEAEQYLPAAKDRTLSRMVPLANQKIAVLSAAEALTLGDWFRSQASSAPDFAKLTALQRARACYERYLEADTTENSDHLRVNLAVNQLGTEISKRTGIKSGPVDGVHRILVVPSEQFEKVLADAFPSDNNVAGAGTAKATSQYENCAPGRALEGRRTGMSWVLNGDSGEFEVNWDQPPAGRFILLFGRGSGTGDRWGVATVQINEGRPLPLQGISGSSDVLIDLGAVTAISDVKIVIHGSEHPGLAGLEIHRQAAKDLSHLR